MAADKGMLTSEVWQDDPTTMLVWSETLAEILTETLTEPSLSQPLSLRDI